MSIGAPPLWYGLLLVALPADPPNPPMYLAAYDDGDIKRFIKSELEANVAMKMLVAADDNAGGVVANNKGLPEAHQLTWFRKTRGEPVPIGVLLGYSANLEVLAGETISTAHIVDIEMIQKIDEGTTARSRSKSSQSVRDRLAFHTFRRGDCAHHLTGEEQDPKVGICIYGVIYKAKEGASAADQGRKVLVLYDTDAEMFFLGKWTDYARVSKNGRECDLNNSELVEEVSTNILKSMESAYAGNTELQAVKSWAYVVKLAETSVPPSVKIFRAKAKKDAIAAAKAANKERKQQPETKRKRSEKANTVPDSASSTISIDLDSRASECGGSGHNGSGDFHDGEFNDGPPHLRHKTNLPPSSSISSNSSIGLSSREQYLELQLTEARALFDAQVEQLRKAQADQASLRSAASPHSAQTETVKEIKKSLPPGWKSTTDPASKRVYYYNKQLGLSQFEEPAMDSPPLPPPPPPLRLTHRDEPPPPPSLMLAPPTSAVTATSVTEGSRNIQATRMRAMLPFLDGAHRAYTAGEIAVLELLDR